MYQYLTQFAVEETAEKTGLAVLGIDPKALLLQLITFLLLFIILKRFAFKKIIAVLEERQKTINKGVDLGREMEAEKQRLDEKADKILHDARKEADKIIAEGHTQAGQIIKEAEKTAQRKVNAMLDEARAHISEDIIRTRKQLEKETLALVAEATEALIAEKMTPEKDQKLIARILQGVRGS